MKLRLRIPSTETRPGRALRFGAALLALALLVALRVPMCPVAIVTGHPCPGCGLTRATLALLRGDLAETLRFHPLAPLVSPLLGGLLAYAAIAYVRVGRWPAMNGRAAGWLAGGGIALWVLLLAVWIARFFGAFGGPVAV
jgi:hypothetical protein